MLDQTIAQTRTKDMQAKLMAGISAAAEPLGVESGDLATDRGNIMDNEKALAADALSPVEMLPQWTPQEAID